jgi:hypothetical protein
MKAQYASPSITIITTFGLPVGAGGAAATRLAARLSAVKAAINRKVVLQLAAFFTENRSKCGVFCAKRGERLAT